MEGDGDEGMWEGEAGREMEMREGEAGREMEMRGCGEGDEGMWEGESGEGDGDEDIKEKDKG